MPFKITKKWLERRADLDENAVVTAGSLSMDDLVDKANALRQSAADTERLVLAFGKLVYFLRVDRGMSMELLAKQCDVDEEELKTIESDPKYVPEPRTVHQLAKVLRFPERRLLQLAGHVVVSDSKFSECAERFAARAGSIEKLSKEQYEALRQFVQYLGQK